jgi:hypothetical protein
VSAQARRQSKTLSSRPCSISLCALSRDISSLPGTHQRMKRLQRRTAAPLSHLLTHVLLTHLPQAIPIFETSL